MKCSYKGNMTFQLDNGKLITLVRWVKAVKGNQYFIAKEDGQECIYYVKSRDVNDNIVAIEKVR